MIMKSVEARRNASRFLPSSWSSVKIGTNAALSAESANSERTTLGIAKAKVNALKAGVRPKNAEARTSRIRPATRLRPVRIEKIAVLRAKERRGGREDGSERSPAGGASLVTGRGCYGPGAGASARAAPRVLAR